MNRQADVVHRLFHIKKEIQCDCDVCTTVGDAAHEIETLRSIGDALVGAIRMGMWESLDILIDDWKDARTQKPHKEGQ